MSFIRNLFRKPAAANHFNIEFRDKDWQQSWLDIFSSQVERVDINLVEQLVTVNVRQLAAGHIQDLIMHILKKEYRTIEEARLYPLHNRAYEFVFTSGKLIDHFVAYHYKDRSPLVHTLIFDFEEVIMHTNKVADTSEKLSKKSN
jgi:hypothetical protein